VDKRLVRSSGDGVGWAAAAGFIVEVTTGMFAGMVVLVVNRYRFVGLVRSRLTCVF